MSNPTYSWSTFSDSSLSPDYASWNSVSMSSSWSEFTPTPVSLEPYATSIGRKSSYTIIVETFTVPLGPVSTVCSTPASLSTSPSASTTALDKVVATFTIPFGSGSTTLLHTFTYTNSASGPGNSQSAPPTSSASISPLPSPSLSIEENRDHLIQRAGMSMITASFTLTVPSPTASTASLDGDSPSPHMSSSSLSLSTARFTLTLPSTPPSATPTETKVSQTTSWSSCDEVSTKTQTPCSKSSTASAPESTTCSESLFSSQTRGLPRTLTFTLTTRVTITLGNTPKTTTCTEGSTSTTSALPSGSSAITLTYTLPSGPGRSSQVVTLTTDRPTAQTGVTSVSLTSPSASWPHSSGSVLQPAPDHSHASGTTRSVPATASTPSSFPNSSVPWFSSYSSSSSPPYATGSVLTSSAVSPSVSLFTIATSSIGDAPAPATSTVIVITMTTTYTSVHTASSAPSLSLPTSTLAFLTATAIPPFLNASSSHTAPTGTNETLAQPTPSSASFTTNSMHVLPSALATGTVSIPLWANSTSLGMAASTHAALILRTSRRSTECAIGAKNAVLVMGVGSPTIYNGSAFLAESLSDIFFLV